MMSAQFPRGRALPVPVAGQRPRWRRPRLPIRLRVWARKGALDAQLAGGVDPESSELLSLRGAQLTSERNRRRLAEGLETLIAPRTGPASLSSIIRPRADLRRSRVVLVALQRRLRSDEQLEPGGIAVLKWLLSDTASPLYTDGDPETVSSLLRLAAARMIGSERA